MPMVAFVMNPSIKLEGTAGKKMIAHIRLRSGNRGADPRCRNLLGRRCVAWNATLMDNKYISQYEIVVWITARLGKNLVSYCTEM